MKILIKIKELDKEYLFGEYDNLSIAMYDLQQKLEELANKINEELSKLDDFKKREKFIKNFQDNVELTIKIKPFKWDYEKE